MARAATLLCALAALAAAGCGSDRATRGEGTLRVVATTVPLADIARSAGGRRVVVTAIVPRDADPHRWRPRPADLGPLGAADLVVRSGGAIDAWAEGAGAERILTVLPRVRPIGDDVHWWLDPVRVQRAVKEIRNELARADVDGAGYYEAAGADYLARLRRLDRHVRRCLPRRLLGSPERLAAQHRAFGYFTARYGVRFVPPRRATVGRRLWGDTLGPLGSASESYLGAMAVNTEQIVDALSGGGERCRPRP